jgi:hypothetical protein
MISSWSPAAHLAKFCAQHLDINVGIKMIGSPPRDFTSSDAPRTQRWPKVISMAVGSRCDGSPSAADRAATTFSH